MATDNKTPKTPTNPKTGGPDIGIKTNKTAATRPMVAGKDMGGSCSTASSCCISKEQISKRAWELWNSAGRPNGRDLEFWGKAEKELKTTNA